MFPHATLTVLQLSGSNVRWRPSIAVNWGIKKLKREEVGNWGTGKRVGRKIDKAENYEIRELGTSGN